MFHNVLFFSLSSPCFFTDIGCALHQHIAAILFAPLWLCPGPARGCRWDWGGSCVCLEIGEVYCHDLRNGSRTDPEEMASGFSHKSLSQKTHPMWENGSARRGALWELMGVNEEHSSPESRTTIYCSCVVTYCTVDEPWVHPVFPAVVYC